MWFLICLVAVFSLGLITVVEFVYSIDKAQRRIDDDI